MESGPPRPDRPGDDDVTAERGAAGPPEVPPAPQAPSEPASPQAPASPGSPQAPASPGSPQAPASPGFPQAPGPPAPGPESAPGPVAPSYGGPVPPGGWQQPIAGARGGSWEGTPLASWGSRAAAAVIDGLIVGIPAIVLFAVLFAGALGLSDDDASVGAIIAASILWFVVVAAVALLYAPTTMAREGAHNGQTLGKQLLRIRVVRDTGESMSFLWAALREVVVKGLVVGIASSIVPVLPWLLDVLWPLWDSENRALHDMIVQTHVVHA